MSYSVETTPNFDREAKRLSRKYPSLRAELTTLIQQLESNPNSGVHLGQQVFKIRIAIASKGKGKRGGGRVMTYVKVVAQTVYLFSIYSKGEKDDISDQEIQSLIQDIL